MECARNKPTYYHAAKTKQNQNKKPNKHQQYDDKRKWISSTKLKNVIGKNFLLEKIILEKMDFQANLRNTALESGKKCQTVRGNLGKLGFAKLSLLVRDSDTHKRCAEW